MKEIRITLPIRLPGQPQKVFITNGELDDGSRYVYVYFVVKNKVLYKRYRRPKDEK